jgi:hypothetical protein
LILNLVKNLVLLLCCLGSTFLSTIEAAPFSARGAGKPDGVIHAFRTQVPQYVTESKTALKTGGRFAGSLGANFLQYALIIGGIGASAAIIEDYHRTGAVHPQKALDFITDSDFMKAALGIFAGATVFSLAALALPAGIPAFLQIVPGFFGAHLGLEVSQGTLSDMNMAKALVASVAASAAFVAMGSGILAIGGGILASMAANNLYDEFFKKPSLQPAPPHHTPLKDWKTVLETTPESQNSRTQGSTDETRLKDRLLFRQREDAVRTENREEFLRLR